MRSDINNYWIKANNFIPIVIVITVHDGDFYIQTGWRTKCHTIDCERNTFYYYKNI